VAETALRGAPQATAPRGGGATRQRGPTLDRFYCDHLTRSVLLISSRDFRRFLPKTKTESTSAPTPSRPKSEVDAETRAWIDADMICQRELNDRKMRVTILRAAAIVGDGGSFLHSPPLERGESPAGFDPMFSVISDRDVARALVLGLHGEVAGTFNIAGNEVFPRSELVPSHSKIGPIPVPAVVRGALSLLDQALGLRLEGATPFHRYGIVLDTRQSAEQLGFEPQYRVEVRRQGGERRVEAVRYR
jgi:nucleoside-diphosphate-sugar epimerase